jgi:hypothetical protein
MVDNFGALCYSSQCISDFSAFMKRVVSQISGAQQVTVSLTVARQFPQLQERVQPRSRHSVCPSVREVKVTGTSTKE